MPNYRKKPVVISAMLWDGINTNDVIKFAEGNASLELGASGSLFLVVRTLEDGDNRVKHAASVGDYIIRGVQGEYYPCKPDIFEKTYELVKD